MAKIAPLIQLVNKKHTILEIADLIIDFYKKLQVSNNVFSKIRVVSEKEKLYDSIDVNGIDSNELLANEMLDKNRKDIIKFDNVENPDINFLMLDRTIINISLEVQDEQSHYLTLNFSFSNSKYLSSSIGSIVVEEKCFDTFEKIKYFLNACTHSFNVKHSTIKISDRELNKKNRAFKSHFGLITYFSNDYEIEIPNDLKGIEYEFTEKGKYLSVISKEDYREEDIEIYKEKLLKVMEQISQRVPGYVK